MVESKVLSRIYEWRVRVGLMGAIASVLLARVTPLSLFFGLSIALCGLLIRAWACGHLIKEKELATSGPYRYTRNPLYFGNFIIGIGVIVSANSWWTLIIFTVYFLIFYTVIILVEKDRMQKLFPQEYKEYSRKVPLVFPVIQLKYSGSKRKFNWSLFRQNKESRALIGILAYWSLFALKMVIF
jgi:protein-S-isoprenylcysteine O-methyltransferase Ste14